ncbi:MAG: hypothetical protein H0T60_11730 [Acidobacteria bacterium]|nr:hypothetical protein [Acidobacteriota bacterium]
MSARDVRLRFRAPDSARDITVGADLRREVYLIFKESVNNLAKHSGCAEAAIAFSIEGRRLVVEIVDDGRGFDAEALGGGAPMSPEVARRVITLFRDFRPPQRADYELTPHETRILKLLVEGHNYKTAAFELNVSVNTVSFHLKKIYEKLQVHSKSEAVAKALRDQIIK